jgi:5-(carboxyamino)imidazole ribonucleotide mutase
MKVAGRSPLVGIVMGSASDWEVMREAAKQLTDFSVPYEAKVLSAHRSPDALTEWVEQLTAKGASCFIAGAGGAAHLAGVIAAKTTLPVLGVPMPSKYLQGLDSLLSIVQMPKGIPVATFAIGEAGAANAGLFAVAMLAQGDAKLAKLLAQFRASQAEAVKNAKLPG